MSNIHTSGYFFEVENFGGWNNGVSKFYYYQTVNTNEHIYSFSYNGATITPNSNYETIVYKTNQSAWFDYDGSTNPFSLTTANGITTGTDNTGAVIMKWGHSGYPDPTIVSSGPTVTSGRVARSGSIPLATAFTVRFPTMTKTDSQRIKIQWYDQNEPNTGYNMTVTWQTASGEHSSTQAITQGSGDIYLDFILSAQAFQIKNGLVKLQISIPVYYNGLLYGADAIFKTFTYHETGPFTASFSPDFGLPGQSVNVIVADTNPFPDETSQFWFRGFDGTVHANDHNFHIDASGTTTGTTTFTSTHGNYNLYKGTRYDTSSLLATANYDTNYVTTTTSNGGGKPDRYPLIMTNLFNRNRSLYSIGMTHKDTWDLFL